MTWLIIGVLIWIAVAIPVAIIIGRSIRLAEAYRKQEHPAGHEANFVATDAPPATAPPTDDEEQPWTGPSTVPFAASRLPWGGQRASGRRARPASLRPHAAPSEPSSSSPESPRD